MEQDKPQRPRFNCDQVLESFHTPPLPMIGTLPGACAGPDLPTCRLCSPPLKTGTEISSRVRLGPPLNHGPNHTPSSLLSPHLTCLPPLLLVLYLFSLSLSSQVHTAHPPPC